MDCGNLTPEICTAISREINSLFYKLGLPWFIVLFLAIVIIYYFIKDRISKDFENYKSDLEKISTKDIELWKQQKELMFDFVNFLETKIFNNSNLEAEKKQVFAELNSYYGKLYLVMETNVLVKINEYIQGTTSPVQRYYLYKELRKQLMSIMHQEFNEKDYPYIDGDSTKVWIFKDNKKVLSKDIEEVKKDYPFVEESSKGSYKAIPFFAEKE